MNFTTSGISFYLADWLVDPKSNSIARGDNSQRVEPKVMQVLVLLAANAGQVVSRRELEDEIWTDMVVGPDSLTNTVIKLRRALGDDAKNARIIETIPKTGYRLIAAVREVTDAEPALERRLSAILYADVAEYSRLTGENEERTHRILSASLDFFTDTIRAYNGKVVHYAGDAILSEFTTVTEALSCAVEVQRELCEKDNAQTDGLSVQFRIGINLGEVIVDRDDIYGEGVNIAARLEGLADAGGVCISESVYAAVGNKLPLDYDFMGEQSVKNIAEPVRAYRVLFYPGSKKARHRPRSTVKIASLFTVFAFAILGFVFLWAQFFKLEGDDNKKFVAANPDRPTIAVLPFASVSVDVKDDLLAEGMTRDIITDLTKVSGVDVIAYNSMRDYQDREIDVEKICIELGAQHIVEGSIRRAGERVRINVQLIDCKTRRHRWAERYDEVFEDFFVLQDKVIAQVVSEISVTLTASESVQIGRPPTSNLKAYDYYLRAQQAGYTASGTAFLDTIDWYKKAIKLDPEFAAAHSGLARAAVAAWRTDISNIMSGIQARTLAYESASRALEIDPANGQAYSVLAVLQIADGQYEAALESARKAVSLAPGSAEAHLDLGIVLAYSGDSKQGVIAVETALRLNPSSPETHLYSGIVFFIDGQYQRAVEALSRAMDERGDAEQAWIFLAAAYGLLEQQEEASATVASLLEIYPILNYSYYRARDSYFRQAEDLDRLIRGLAVAGLPEWPYGFDASAFERIGAAELRQLVVDQNWEGKHKNGVEFFQHVDASGSLAYRSQNSLQAGKAKIDGDQLCQRFDNSVLNRDACGFVYRNPTGSAQTQDDYIVVMPDSLRYFTVTP
jgi:adenylate cyclase